MSDPIESETDSARPTSYWLMRTVLGLAIAGLGGLELFSGRTVSPGLLFALVTVAGGTEVARQMLKN